ncbi:hypothetical protein O181_061212 [Austropuccinia psidii MF-1]|uniref:Uncharacterized protein n=1 Tax=Austropuccinia psidii MF-1 TaxID=1389203 RepID=A0A9Q3EK74_9BASI|nr:hypothetical protein [Austropuccinia psidii MF-1]
MCPSLPPHVCNQQSLCFHTPALFLLLLTILRLPWHPIDMCPPATEFPHSTILMLLHTRLILSAAYHAYACAAPIDMHPPTTPCPPLTIFTLPHAHLILSTVYHAYAPAVPSIYDSAPAPLPLTMLIPPALP